MKLTLFFFFFYITLINSTFATISGVVKLSHSQNFGSGFYYKYGGQNYIVSAAHILGDLRSKKEKIKVTLFDNKTGYVVNSVYAKLLVVDEIRDVMILKPEGSKKILDQVESLVFSSSINMSERRDQNFFIAGVNRDLSNTLNILPIKVISLDSHSPSIHGFKRNLEFYGAEAGFSGGPLLGSDGGVWGMVMQYTLGKGSVKGRSEVLLPTRHGIALIGDELEQFVIKAIDKYSQQKKEHQEDWVFDGGWEPAIKYNRRLNTLEYKGMTLGYRRNESHRDEGYGFRYAGVTDREHELSYKIEVKKLVNQFNQKTDLSINYVASKGVVKTKFEGSSYKTSTFDVSVRGSTDSVRSVVNERDKLFKHYLIGAIAVVTNRKEAFVEATTYFDNATLRFDELKLSSRKFISSNDEESSLAIDFIDKKGIRVFNIRSLRDVVAAFLYAKKNKVHDNNIVIMPEADFITSALDYFNTMVNYEKELEPRTSLPMIPGFNYGLSMGRTYHVSPYYPAKAYLEIYKIFKQKFEENGISISMVAQDNQPIINKCSILSLLPLYLGFHNYFLNFPTESLTVKKITLKQTNWKDFTKRKNKLFYDHKTDTATVFFHYGYQLNGNYRSVYDENELKKSELNDLGTISCSPTPIEFSAHAALQIIQYSRGELRNIDDGGVMDEFYNLFGF
ncbi:MAG: serine protease [Halobacteriovoraceae bacterium]|jgi:hypothetical protein|nr:serine protease [Halobacteriovoraceae bacterium]